MILFQPDSRCVKGCLVLPLPEVGSILTSYARDFYSDFRTRSILLMPFSARFSCRQATLERISATKVSRCKWAWEIEEAL
jgi:hypothetical protein